MNSPALTPEILLLISEIDYFKGFWRASRIPAARLKKLKRAAIIESAASSVRISGGVITAIETATLFDTPEAGLPASPDEEDAAGYLEALNRVYQQYKNFPLTETAIRQLQSEMMRFSETGRVHSGRYKQKADDAARSAKNPDQLLPTADPADIPLKMTTLLDDTCRSFAQKQHHPIILTALFTARFLDISPFEEGNGRLSRILTALLLLKSGYEHVPCCSLESSVEQYYNKYFGSIKQAQAGLKVDNPDWQPWLLVFLKTLKDQQHKLAAKIELEKRLEIKLPQLAGHILELIATRGRITVSEAQTLTGAKPGTVKNHIAWLMANHHIQKHGTTKGAWYSLNGNGE